MDAPQHPLESITSGDKPAISSGNEDPSQPAASAAHVLVRPSSVMLRPEEIDSPAVIIDHKLRVCYANSAAASDVWCDTVRAIDGSIKPFLYDMLLDSNYRRSVDNWRSWVAFFTEQVRSVVSVKSMRNHIGRLDATKRQMLRSLIDDQLESPGPSGTLYSGMLRQIRTSGKITFFHAVAANYKAGRLIIFEIDQAEDGASAHFSKRRIQHSIRAVRRYHRPVKVPVYILGAALHRPDRLKSEMLDDAFAAMTHRVWSQCLSIIENHGGVFGKHAGGGCYGHFLPQGTPDDTALRAIRCSLDIASSMEGISREYKLRRVWPHEIQLNIGLHRERGYVGALNTATGEVLSSTGDGLGLAARLSEIGDRGQILATKSFFDQLSAAVLDRLRFGVYRGAGGPRGAFSPGGFLPLDAINGERRTGAADRKLRGVSVTQIFDLHQ